jgi:hypothetical protein
MMGESGVMVVQRPPELLHQAYQRGIRNERAAPEPFVQLRFAHDAWSLFDEDLEQVEGLRGDVDDCGIAAQVPSIEIKRERAEVHDHASP